MSLLKNEKLLNSKLFTAKEKKAREVKSCEKLLRSVYKKCICQGSLEQISVCSYFSAIKRESIPSVSRSKGKSFPIFFGLLVVHNQFRFNGFTFSLKISCRYILFFISSLMTFPWVGGVAVEKCNVRTKTKLDKSRQSDDRSMTQMK